MSPPDPVLEVRKALAYLKPDREGSDEPAPALSADEELVQRPFAPGLVMNYVVDQGGHYQYVQARHLAEQGLDAEKLHALGIANLWKLSEERKLSVHRSGYAFAALMGGDFEASLLLLDGLWDKQFRAYVPGDYAVAVPARDILAFCDASSAAGLDELRRVVARVLPSGDYIITNRLYVRRQGKWEALPSE